MENLGYNWCRDCGCKLWSFHYRSTGFCPECCEDDEEPKDLEDRIPNE